MKLSEKVIHFYHKLARTLSRKQKKAWNGLSILVFKDDSALNPNRIRINFYVMFFIGLLVSATPIVALSLYLSRNIKKESPEVMIEKRRVILTNLKLMNGEKGRLLAEVENQIHRFEVLQTASAPVTLDAYLEEALSNGTLPVTGSGDALARDVLEMANLAHKSERLLSDAAYHAIDPIWTRVSLYNLMPRGRPLQPGIGNITSGYGIRSDPFGGGKEVNFHLGVDFAAAPNTPIIATAPGVVIHAITQSDVGYGKNVKIHHGLGYTTLYAHCSKLLVKVGDRVKRGDVIALLGKTGRATGHHVHYEVQMGITQPGNPMEYVKLH